MNEPKRNDATLSRLGDIYQYHIALLNCFRMQAGDEIQIELNGDVTFISHESQKSFQKEIKHHVDSKNLLDRDVDLWNTLKNWVVDYEDAVSFNKLILFTTANVFSDSIFNNWNLKDKDEKYQILFNEGMIHKTAEKVFRPIYQDIFFNSSRSKDELCALLERFEIERLQPQIQNISRNFDPYLATIPSLNRNDYILALLGVVYKNVVNPPYIWNVTFEDFQKQAQDVAPSYMQPGKIPLPLEYATVEPDTTEQDASRNKTFVKALEAIDYKKIIPIAISDYWRATKTIARYFSDNISYTASLSTYKESLSSRMFYTKESVLNGERFTERNQELLASRKMCSEVLGWEANDFGSIVANQPFFQNGVVHNIVDDEDFVWDVGDNHEF